MDGNCRRYGPVTAIIIIVIALIFQMIVPHLLCNTVMSASNIRPESGEGVPGNGARGTVLTRNPDIAKYGPATPTTKFPPTFSQYTDQPSSRTVSNQIMDQINKFATDLRLTALFVYFGQFVDHDVDLAELNNKTDSQEAKDCVALRGTVFTTGTTTIQVPPNDPLFKKPIPFSRTNICIIDGKPQHPNVITSFVDASNVYGSDPRTTMALRTLKNGELRTFKGNPRLLPLLRDIPEDMQEYVETVCPGSDPLNCFAAGDRRVNEHITLTSFHTLWMMEHNYQANRIRTAHPGLSDNDIFQTARRVVIAEMQAIVFGEFVPALLGDECPSLKTRRTKIFCQCCVDGDVTINTEFSTFAYRFGHSAIPNTISFQPPNQPGGELQLQDVFFNSFRTLPTNATLMEGVFKGLSKQKAMAIDNQAVDGLRNFLFENVQGFPLDLIMLNIERGRDHGIRDYNAVRRGYGLARKSFDDISSDPAVNSKYRNTYPSVDRIDAFVGMLGEDPFKTSRIGELGTKILCEQFTRLKRADPFYFECYDDLERFRTTRLSDILSRHFPNTDFTPNVMTQ